MSEKFFVDGSKLPSGWKGRIVVKDAGGKVTCGPFSAGTEAGGPFYEMSAAGRRFDAWEKKGYVVRAKKV